MPVSGMHKLFRRRQLAGAAGAPPFSPTMMKPDPPALRPMSTSPFAMAAERERRGEQGGRSLGPHLPNGTAINLHFPPRARSAAPPHLTRQTFPCQQTRPARRQ